MNNPVVPLRTEYTLSDRDKALTPVLLAIHTWGGEQIQYELVTVQSRRQIVVYESSEYRVQSAVVEEILTDFFES